ncbi:MAG: helix-turn-helix domain-containing protein [Thermoanaerobaculaceae bacterium]
MELTVKDVARALSITEDAVYELVDGQGLPAQQVDGGLRVHRAELLEWANAQGLAVATELFAAPAAALPTLAAALDAGGCRPRPAGRRHRLGAAPPRGGDAAAGRGGSRAAALGAARPRGAWLDGDRRRDRHPSPRATRSCCTWIGRS